MSSSLRGIISCGPSSSCCYCLYSGTKVKYWSFCFQYNVCWLPRIPSRLLPLI
ncbi:hypothetical protein Gohar_025600 [Gossypium harknessii]|uniref:Uncharacterized protein n=1 Tax=Gossypium harknessii TaxID=34285 RepID=A0A7J9IDY4_9ROSI|nr:hypothetical protein [Gossypium harknessii]